MNRKITIIANNDIGLYNFRKEVIEHLLKENKQVDIILPYGEKVHELVNMGCIYHKVSVDRRGTNPIKDLALLHQFKELLREIKPDVVLTYTIKPNIYGGMAAQALGIPYIANITGLGSAVENAGILQKITIQMYRYALRKARCVFFQNTENKKFFENFHVLTGRSELLPGSGVNLSRFELKEYPRGEQVKFLYIARVMREKGIEEYLAAAQAITAKYDNVEFHILGACEEDYTERLKKLEKEGIIIYHGLQQDVRAFIYDSNCTIHPSFYPEGMSNVCLESAASGRPVVTTDRSGCRETVDDGVTGFIVKQKDSKDLIEKVEKFLGLSYEEKRTMGIKAREKMEKEFDRNIVIAKYMKEIETI